VTEDESNAALAAMTVQREQELAGVDAHYKLRKACAARAVDLYEHLRILHCVVSSMPHKVVIWSNAKALLNDIEKDAQS